MEKEKLTVAVIGASAKADRYSYQCVDSLLKHSHEVIPVTPATPEICGLTPVIDLDSIDEDVNVLTMYINAKRSSAIQEQILKLKPKKIIFNPGSENPELAEACEKSGIKTEEACTLVLLNTGQFDEK